jgi:hypothetical protein
MTTQIPDRLVNRFSAIELGELELYGVLQGELFPYDGSGVRYAWKNKPVIPEKRSASLIRGYVSTIVLHEDARLELTRFDYPFSEPRTSTDISEFLEGNGWLRMSPHDAWPRVSIPFRDGRIVGDESQWVLLDKVALGELRVPDKRDWFEWIEPRQVSMDEPVLAGRIARSFQRRDISGGTWVDLEEAMPRQYEWARYQIRRGGKIIARVRTGGSTGEPGGAWLLFGLNELPLEAGDELWAVDRLA